MTIGGRLELDRDIFCATRVVADLGPGWVFLVMERIHCGLQPRETM
jgi:hypothetical protein